MKNSSPDMQWFQRLQDEYERAGTNTACKAKLDSPQAHPIQETTSLNQFIRMAIFRPIRGTEKAFLKGVVIANQRGIRVEFTGRQLNQADRKVWDTLLKVARYEKSSLAWTCEFKPHQILSLMGVETTADYCNALEQAIMNLASCFVIVSGDRYTLFGKLIPSFVMDERTGTFTVHLSENFMRILS